MRDVTRKSILIFTYLVLMTLLLILGVELVILAGSGICTALGLELIGYYIGVFFAAASVLTGVLPRLVNLIARSLISGFDTFLKVMFPIEKQA